MDIIHTKENLFHIVETHNHSALITFKAGTDSYNDLGSAITLTKVFDEDDAIKINIAKEEYSSGILQCLILKADSEKLESIPASFNTEDIFDIAGPYTIQYKKKSN